eukprot:13374244-Alexandrium_andersonii.AAC.1
MSLSVNSPAALPGLPRRDAGNVTRWASGRPRRNAGPASAQRRKSPPAGPRVRSGASWACLGVTPDMHPAGHREPPAARRRSSPVGPRPLAAQRC